MRTTARSPASAGLAIPATTSRAPTSRPAGNETEATSTGTVSARVISPRCTETVAATNRHPPSAERSTLPVTSSRASTDPPPVRARASARTGSANATAAPAAEAAAAATANTATSGYDRAARPRRRATTAAVVASAATAPSTTAAPAATPGTATSTPAAIHAATATGTIRTRHSTSHTLTRSRRVSSIRAPIPAPRAGRRSMRKGVLLAPRHDPLRDRGAYPGQRIERATSAVLTLTRAVPGCVEATGGGAPSTGTRSCSPSCTRARG